MTVEQPPDERQLEVSYREACRNYTGGFALAVFNQEQTADFAVTRRSVHAESITQPHESTRQKEYHDN